MEFERTFSNAPWELQVGYCRAIKAGNNIYVTGTAAVDEEGKPFAPGNAYAQTKRCLELIESALKKLGADMTDIVRTRMFVTDISLWAEYGRAHRECFSSNPPATSMIEVKSLIDPSMLVEIEAEAIRIFS
jgi:enamine deaminase RidA (YjgF/YER057c/UK114 family)